MNNETSWKASLEAFFSSRAQSTHTVSFEDLCYVSGRDARLWKRPGLYDDLITDILSKMHMDGSSSVLEVGCASGFLANGVTPKVKSYTGVDIASSVLEAAKRLALNNAEFRLADGSSLPYRDGQFDGAYCYDVFTNFPSFNDGEAIIREMLRVVKPGGKVLIGSIPDAALEKEYQTRTAEVAVDLESEFGPPSVNQSHQHSPLRKPWWRRLLAKKQSAIKPEIVCYYFNRSDFESLGNQLGVPCSIVDIHGLNPYAGYRFNAIYTKPIQ